MSSFEHLYRGAIIRVVAGDIAGLEVDAIVNPANSLMHMGGGVAGAIKRVGGTGIEAEALKKAPVKVVDAIATKAGKLPARFVIHAPTMTRPAMQTNEENARQAIRGALECAQELGIHSVAFPGLGTGVGGLSMEAAVNVMMQELKKHLGESTTLREVVFIGFRKEAAEEFEKAFVKTFKSVG